MPPVKFAAPLVLLASLAACGEQSAEPVSRNEVAPPKEVSEAAKLLSLGGQIASESGTGYELAVNCAVALNVTALTLAPMATSANRKEIDQVQRAAEAYETRAVEAADGLSERQVKASIARETEARKDEKGEQAQLAIVCLRSLPQAS